MFPELLIPLCYIKYTEITLICATEIVVSSANPTIPKKLVFIYHIYVCCLVEHIKKGPVNNLSFIVIT